MMQPAVDSLYQQELVQQENLIEILSITNGSKSSDNPNGSLLSIVRGLCTYNQKLITLLSESINEANKIGFEAYKTLINEFIIWFADASAVFKRYFECLPHEGFLVESVYQKPLTHYSNYVVFIDSVLSRNPFVMEKLKEAKSTINALMTANKYSIQQAYLDNIAFDQVKGLNGLVVSCFFTVDQIMERTKDTPMFLGDVKVELLLLNLDKDSTTYTMRDFNALAILEIPSQLGPRAVMFPPFRINDLSMTLSYNCINFSSVAYGNNNEGASFALTGPENDIQEWFEKLKLLFPSADEVLSSENISLAGLGINTTLESYQPEESFLYNQQDSSLAVGLGQQDLSSYDDDKNFGTDMLACVESHSKGSLPSHTSFEEEHLMNSDSFSINSDDFELVTKPTKVVFNNQVAANSLPELQVATKPVFQNAAGSAIDITNFGKTHNPTFTPELKFKDASKRKSFFGFFSKKKESQPTADSNNSKSEKAKQTTSKAKIDDSKKKKKSKNELRDFKVAGEKSSDLKQQSEIACARARPDLTISIPKTFDVPNASFSLKSTQFSPRSTVPLPFALPSSTSMYFFKHYINETPNLSDSNLSSANLNDIEQLLTLQVPQGLKDEINADDTLDFYISPSNTKTLRVSKWKARAGKWEMLTTSDEVFVKIVVNYILDKRWLLVFKEQTIDGEVVDVPLLILDLTIHSKFRRSSASDIELGAVNSVTNEKMLVIIRCYKGDVFEALFSSLENILESLKTPDSLQKSSAYESSATLTSSLLSRPSTTSTLSSMHMSVDHKSISEMDISNDGDFSGGEKILLDRMTIKLHKQMESYERRHEVSTWNTVSMFSLSLSHSVDEFGASFYHFEFANKRSKDEDFGDLEWIFNASQIKDNTEQIGKAGLLVTVGEGIYMLECKGSKELKRLLSTIS